MALIKLSNNGVKNITSVGSIGTGDLVFISKQTASSDASISFTSGIDSTYKEYVFYFVNCHPSANGGYFQLNFRDGGTDYDATKTTTSFSARHKEDDSTAELSYKSGSDLTQETGFQNVDVHGISNDDDNAISGILHLFNPSSTTFVKHFLIRSVSGTNADDNFIAGYCNTTSAIDGVQFKFQSGNIDSGDILLYGVN